MLPINTYACPQNKLLRCIGTDSIKLRHLSIGSLMSKIHSYIGYIVYNAYLLLTILKSQIHLQIHCAFVSLKCKPFKKYEHYQKWRGFLQSFCLIRHFKLKQRSYKCHIKKDLRYVPTSWINKVDFATSIYDIYRPTGFANCQ